MKKKILIIEDDQIVANIYRNKFSVEGYDVEIALDGEAGAELIKSFHPDAVILDLVLPKLTGVEIMKRVRAEPDTEKLPIIVFSNTYLTNMVQDAWKAGATKCLSKANCTPRQVLDAIRSVIGVNGTAPTATATSPVPAAPINHSPRSPAAAVATNNTTADLDAKFQAELRKSFVESLPETLTTLRTLLKHLAKAADEAGRVRQLKELYRRVHAVTGNASIAGLPQIANMTAALEALLKELYEKPNNFNASTLRTVATAIDFLGQLFEHGTAANRWEVPPPRILVVDDEAISRRAVTYALDKAKLLSVSVEDPALALTQLSEGSFDLIFLDVDMPGMTGFELCTKLRAMSKYKKTPVVFVTSLTDFESRASSFMSGGNDFIAKPFLFIELAVKALVYSLRGKMPLAK